MIEINDMFRLRKYKNMWSVELWQLEEWQPTTEGPHDALARFESDVLPENPAELCRGKG